MVTIKQPEYQKSNYQQGWGIGYHDGNVSGGFNDFNNYGALQNEINRMNTVIQNRTGYGMGNDAQTNYLNQLNSYYQPYQQQQQNITNAQNTYQNSQAKADADRWANATIQDIAAKYGFNFSRDYAKQQAEAEAQALRNANQDAQRKNEANRDLGKQNIDNNLMNMAEALDRNYFQQMMNQQQNQIESGMNAGIASDQDLRLQMARQAEMGASYRDANLGHMSIDRNFSAEELRLAEALGLINQQALAREDALYNDRLMQGYSILDNDRNFYNSRDQQMWGRSQAEIDRALGQQNFLQNIGLQQSQIDWSRYMDEQGLSQWQQQFDYGKSRDLIGDQQWQQQFDYGKSRDLIGDQQWQDQFDWSKVLGQHGMTMAERQLAEQQAARRAASQAQASQNQTMNAEIARIIAQMQEENQKRIAASQNSGGNYVGGGGMSQLPARLGY